MTGTEMFGPGWRRAVPWVLVLASAAVFLPVLGAGFVRWDDDLNFVNNHEFGDLNKYGLRWAWTTRWLGVYQPMAWMLLELEHTFWGLDPRGYHATSLVLYAINTAVLYGLTVSILRRFGPDDDRAVRAGSAIAAALFAVHPLRVEVVAWASCQPYLPSVLSSMLAVLAYLRANPAEGRVRWQWLALAWLMTVAAMLFKAIAVSLPLVFLILDIYPLRRLGPGRRPDPSYWLEKLAFAAPAVALMVIALGAKGYPEPEELIADYGLGARLGQTFYGVVFYLIKTAWPVRLSAYYPTPARVDLLRWPFHASAIAVLSVSAIAVAIRRRYPGVLAAWVLYLLILAPNLGFIRTGSHFVADRYAYMASIPLVVATAWGLSRFIRWSRDRPAPALGSVAGIAGVVVLVVFGTLSWRQCRTWQTSKNLWTNALAVGDGRNLAIQRSLAASMIDEGEVEEGVALLRQTLVRDPEAPMVHYNLGVYEVMEGRFGQAEGHFVAAVRGLKDNSPYLPDAHYNLGVVLERQGRLADALVEYGRAAQLNPRDPTTQNNLGSVLLQLGRYADAEARFSEAVRLEPDYTLARQALEHARRMRSLEATGGAGLPVRD
jgi:protein O-mannosyl-transferase